MQKVRCGSIIRPGADDHAAGDIFRNEPGTDDNRSGFTGEAADYRSAPDHQRPAGTNAALLHDAAAGDLHITAGLDIRICKSSAGDIQGPVYAGICHASVEINGDLPGFSDGRMCRPCAGAGNDHAPAGTDEIAGSGTLSVDPQRPPGTDYGR